MLLAMTFAGPNQPDVLPEVMRSITESRCTLVESRMTVCSGQFAGHCYVEGNWNHIAKLENNLTAVTNRFRIKMVTSRADENNLPAKEASSALPYTIDLICEDRPGILSELAKFLLERKVHIQDITSSGYSAPHTGAPIFSARIIVGIPSDIRLITLRDEFLDFCERANFDALLEPSKR